MLIELGYRVYLSFRVGPSVLLYGTALHRRYILPTTDPQIGQSESNVHFGEQAESRDHREPVPWREWKAARSIGAINNSRDGYRKYVRRQCRRRRVRPFS